MLKSTIVVLAMFGSVSAMATSPLYQQAVQDQKAVGAVYTYNWDAIQDQKAVGGVYSWAVQDQKAVSLESQTETIQLLDLNEGF